jgi:hypothetical protein
VLQHPWITRFRDVPTIPLKTLSSRSLRTFIPQADGPQDDEVDADIDVV